MLGEHAEYAGALVLPLLFVGAGVAVVVTGLVTIPPARSRLLRLSFASLGTLLVVSSSWLVLYATGRDTYYGPSHVSRWEHASRFMGTWPVTLAVIGAAATGVGLLASAYSPARTTLRVVLAPAAAVSCLLLIFGWFSLTAGH